MKKEYLFASGSILLWSTMAVTSKLLLVSFSNIQVLCVSSLLAGLALLAFNAVTGKLRLAGKYKLTDYLMMALIGFLGTFLYYIFYYAGAARLLASQAFIINYMWPIMSVVFACVILKEKMTARKTAAIAVSFLGVTVVTGGGLLQFDAQMLLGSGFCLMGAVSYGLFTALSQKTNYDKSFSMMIGSFVTFGLSGLILLGKSEPFAPTGSQLLGLIWNGVFTMAIANTLWVLALEKGNTAKISNLAYITPALSLVWSSLILKEPLSIYSILGLVIIIAGIFLQPSAKNSQKQTP